MNPALKIELLTVADYLAGEEQGLVRHEFVDGQVFAMAGASQEHNIIALNVASTLRARLRGSPCRAFIGDMKTRVAAGNRDQFYYPDIVVTCDPRDTERYFKCFPKVVIEVLSEATERIDRTEKFWSYAQIETLEEYVLIAQDRMEVTVYRRENRWEPEVFSSVHGRVRVDALQLDLAFDEIYEGLKLPS